MFLHHFVQFLVTHLDYLDTKINNFYKGSILWSNDELKLEVKASFGLLRAYTDRNFRPIPNILQSVFLQMLELTKYWKPNLQMKIYIDNIYSQKGVIFQNVLYNVSFLINTYKINVYCEFQVNVS